mmetsp:Transcript_5761/g.10495  ORF Transcript_5761/g.10495 Transcript_5761/m.10495 type:complete len:213 (+) Transcript_5761:1198-1836(+)
MDSTLHNCKEIDTVDLPNAFFQLTNILIDIWKFRIPVPRSLFGGSVHFIFHTGFNKVRQSIHSPFHGFNHFHGLIHTFQSNLIHICRQGCSSLDLIAIDKVLDCLKRIGIDSSSSRAETRECRLDFVTKRHHFLGTFNGGNTEFGSILGGIVAIGSSSRNSLDIDNDRLVDIVQLVLYRVRHRVGQVSNGISECINQTSWHDVFVCWWGWIL